ncbi:MAG: phospho-N-acetylmuramoyl-pentapeptide-transferase [Phototrophicales bacterium]
MVSGLPFALSVGMITFLLCVIWGGPFVEILRRLRIGKQIQVELSEEHQKKVGTPTMGGIMIVIPVVLIVFVLNIANVVQTGQGASTFLPLIVLLGFGFLGAIDDWEGVRRSRGPIGTGISPRAKFTGQLILSGFVAGTISLFEGGFSFANEVDLPLLPYTITVSPVLFIPMTMFIIIGTSNAVNLTDGLDGLAGIITASAFAAYGVIAYLQGQIFLVQLCFVLVGACFAFLWYNAHPAQLFMGDTGSLALGATLGTIAVMTGQWLLLPIIAIVPVAETVSVILQVASAKYSRKYLGEDRRLFRMAPLHLHFQKGGWSETQIVQRFWLVGMLSAMVGVALALI